MRQRYSVFFRPWRVFYYEDHQSGKQATFKTRNKDEAFRLVAAKNENEEDCRDQRAFRCDFTRARRRQK